MKDETDQHSALPSSVSENIGTIADFYARHEEHVTTTQRAMEKVALFLGSPVYIAGNIGFILCWILINITATDLHFKTFDPPPFSLLQGIITLNAFVISTTVLIRQNRMSRLADHHAHLDLQVNLLTEEKTSKIIELIDQLRRDLPNVRSEVDSEAEELAKPADPKAVLEAIESKNDAPYGEAGERARKSDE
ncbi:DUF1003 domain-containing protein [Massilia phyllosphaerae]|uniref:DUF1003 domain-containing protein n=1 Tax=Massilia phyllosphaerae TaxID=3106034 RepID=UPI002B1CB144|nr:DUF1003 domain-containing protein [Massilia sp. SGZ-792]